MTDPTITPAEYAALRFHGGVPGLLRRGSPVHWRDEVTPWVVAWVGPWPDSDSLDDGQIALIAPCASPCLGMDTSTADLALDLLDATGRAHLREWVASHITSRWGRLDPVDGLRWHRSHRGHWELWATRVDEPKRWQEVCFLPWAGDGDLSDQNQGVNGSWCRYVPTLTHLDPTDPRLLPDGSRLVDALALAAVGRHVAGLEVAGG